MLYAHPMNTSFDTLTAARNLEGSGIESKQAEAIVQAIRSSGETAITRADLDAAISTAVNKMMVSQVAVAGLLFAAIKLFG